MGSRINKISAIILAAGLSQRMGKFKPMMKLGGQTILQKVISLYEQADVCDIRIVGGHRFQEIQASLSSNNATIIYNPDFESGMFSSVLAGINSLPDSSHYFFIHPVDIPLVRPHTISELMDVAEKYQPSIVYPGFGQERGHPPLISTDLIDTIVTGNGAGGLRAILERFEPASNTVLVADEGVLLDMDTPENWRQLSTRFESAHILNGNECRELMQTVQGVPQPVIDHCDRVAQVAKALSKAVSSHLKIDIPLIRSAAKVHDLAKGTHLHAETGSELLEKMGFGAIAAIVATHMDINIVNDGSLNEAQIVYLADKLVEGKTVVSLQQRFGEKQKKYGHHPEVAAKINDRLQAAVAIKNKVEQLTGLPISQTLKNAGLIQKS